MKIKISVIIPTYNRKGSLVRLLKFLLKEIDNSIEIIIVEQVQNNEKVFRNILKKINLEYFFLKKKSTSIAKNVGIKHAKGSYIIFFDDDVIVKPKIFKSYLTSLVNAEIGGISGRILTQGQKTEPDRKDTGRISFFGNFSDGFSSLVKQEVDTVIGCSAFWRKDLLKKINGFDEQFTGNAMREESDLSLRVKRLGYKIVFEPKAMVEHLREPTGGARKTEGRIQWYFNFFSNETYFFLKHRPKIILPIILLTRWEWILRCMFGFGREVSFRSIITPFLGIYDGFKKYRRLKTKYDYWR